jgi:hypothetical protein
MFAARAATRRRPRAGSANLTNDPGAVAEARPSEGTPPAAPSSAPPSHRRRLPDRYFLAYGVVVAIVAVIFLSSAAPSPWPMMESRQSELTASLRAAERGAPPLVGDSKVMPPGLASTVGVYHGWFPVSATDDDGIYVYAPRVAQLRGTHDPLVGVKWLYLALFGFTIAMYPILFRRLFDSDAAALVAPWALLAGVRWVVGFNDIYWVPAWSILTLIPILMMLGKRWPRRGLAIAVAAMLAASFATSIRSQAGLPLLIAAAMVVLLQPWRWRRRVAVAAAMLAAYVAIAPFGFMALREYRNSWVGGGSTFDTGTAGHPFWHSTYIGLGYLPNRYELHYKDEVANQAAQAEDPGVRYASPEYERAVRSAFMDLVKWDPGFVAAAEGNKALVILGQTGSAAAVLAALAIALALGLLARRRSTYRRFLLILAPALLIGLIPPILAIPIRDYASGYVASLLLVMLVALGAAVSMAARGRSVRGLRAELLAVRPWRGFSRWGKVAVIAAVAFAVLVGVSVSRAPDLQSQAGAWAASAP